MQMVAQVDAHVAEVPRARRLLGQAPVAWPLDGDAADTTLPLTSEPVIDAVRHGRPPVHVRAEGSTVGVVRVGVDAGPSAVRPQEPHPDLGGRGLQLVETLPTAWGSRLGDLRCPAASPVRSLWSEVGAPALGPA